MKRIKKILATIFRIFLLLVTVGAVGLLGYSGWVIYKGMTTEKTEAPAPTVIEQVHEVVAPKSDVEKARDMLAEATAQLDAEEAKLLKEIDDINAEASTKVAEREAKIAEINKIRSSF